MVNFAPIYDLYACHLERQFCPYDSMKNVLANSSAAKIGTSHVDTIYFHRSVGWEFEILL